MSYIIKITPQYTPEMVDNPSLVPEVQVDGQYVTINGTTLDLEAPPMEWDPEVSPVPPKLHPQVSGQVVTLGGDKEITIRWPYFRPAWDVSTNLVIVDFSGPIHMEELPDDEAI